MKGVEERIAGHYDMDTRQCEASIHVEDGGLMPFLMETITLKNLPTTLVMIVLSGLVLFTDN